MASRGSNIFLLLVELQVRGQSRAIDLAECSLLGQPCPAFPRGHLPPLPTYL